MKALKEQAKVMIAVKAPHIDFVREAAGEKLDSTNRWKKPFLATCGR